ncbi:hypothetical protein [Qaidamihabitans albus]|uniref:hypothetical protein n=1 Tax=Qaidamihabitans albus TaxID=2795733 RepID=UPI0018F1673B|nr:hypothetical protein [Qaidamihabitans albus]
MDFESVADELYGVDRDEFTAVRDERAAAARAAGDKELAKRIGGLRKPTSAAALVNGLARARPDEVGRLGEVGDALREAHAELAGERLRALSRQRHELVRALTEQAVELSGTKVSESVTREVSETLEAALADPEAGRAVAEGRLTSALRPDTGFSGDWMAVGPPRKPAAGGKDGKSANGKKKDGKSKDDRAEIARRRREELKQARAALAEARSARDDAGAELRAAEREEAKARRRTEAARKALDAAADEVERAERAVAELNPSS